MPRLPPPEHSRFKPGVSGNPKGRPKFALTIDKVRQIIEKYALMTRAQLQRAMQDDATPMMELWIASVIAQGAKAGDYSRLSAILDRSIGKVTAFEDDGVGFAVKPMTEEQKALATKLLRLVAADGS